MHIQGFRTGIFDKYKYELFECHIKQLFIGYCIRGFLTCCIGLSLFAPCKNRISQRKMHIQGFVNEPTFSFKFKLKVLITEVDLYPLHAHGIKCTFDQIYILSGRHETHLILRSTYWFITYNNMFNKHPSLEKTLESVQNF